MRKACRLLLSMIIFLSAVGCSSRSEMTWQEQYDLGIRYLSEGNYEEAIIAFTAAIEIDPAQVGSHLGLADAHIGVGNAEQAVQTLTNAINIVNDVESLQAKLVELVNSAIEQNNLDLAAELLGKTADNIDSSRQSELLRHYVDSRLHTEYDYEFDGYRLGDFDNDGGFEIFFGGYPSQNLQLPSTHFYCDHDGSDWTELYTYQREDYAGGGHGEITVDDILYYYDWQYDRKEDGTLDIGLLSIYYIDDEAPICVFHDYYSIADGVVHGIDDLQPLLEERFILANKRQRG